MTYSDMKELAFNLTIDDNNKRAGKRNLYYSHNNQVFMHRPTNNYDSHFALTVNNGKVVRAWVGQDCEFIGSYETDVNPFWVLDDMVNV